MRSFIVLCLLAALVAFVGAQDPKGPVDEETGVYDFESHLGKLELNFNCEQCEKTFENIYWKNWFLIFFLPIFTML